MSNRATSPSNEDGVVYYLAVEPPFGLSEEFAEAVSYFGSTARQWRVTGPDSRVAFGDGGRLFVALDSLKQFENARRWLKGHPSIARFCSVKKNEGPWVLIQQFKRARLSRVKTSAGETSQPSPIPPPPQ